MLALQARSSGITLARYAFEGLAWPPVEATLPLAEMARAQVMGLYSKVRQRQRYGRDIPADAERYRSATLAGKDADGRPLAGHRHAFYLPTDEDGDGRLDHLTIVAEAGFDADEVRAFDWLRSLPWGLKKEADPLPRGSDPFFSPLPAANPYLLRKAENAGMTRGSDAFVSAPLRLLLVGLGSARELRVPLLEPSAVWVSATPFLASRYPKPRGRKRDPRELLQPAGRLAFAGRVLGEELARLRERRRTVCQTVPPAERHKSPDLGPDPLLPDSMDKFRTAAVNGASAFGSDPLLPGSMGKGESPCFGGLPEVVAIEPLAEQALGARRLRPWAFQRCRRKPSDDGGRRAHGAFRITFAQPTAGPLCLGHACHFGMGLFVPESQETDETR